MNTYLGINVGSVTTKFALLSEGLRSNTQVRIAGRCTVFAESDMIHKQQVGYRIEDIIFGLCEAMVRNYLNNVGLGKEILPPVIFQGGVAFNKGIIKACSNLCEIAQLSQNGKPLARWGGRCDLWERVSSGQEKS